MSTTSRTEGARASWARALVLLQRYSTEITDIAVRTLGAGSRIGNNEIALVMALHAAPGGLPSGALADAVGLDRSQTSRYLARLEADGVLTRVPTPWDARRRMVALTRVGRARVARFSRELGDHAANAAPTMKELLELLGRGRAAEDVVDPLTAAAAMSAAGQRFVTDAVSALQRYGIAADTRERFTLGLLAALGTLRPSQIADELACDPATATLVLNRLTDAGLVVRAHDALPGDRRAVVVSLTPTGVRAADELLACVREHATDLGAALALTQPAPSPKVTRER